ncbi:hypothetical protein ES695_03220 [Candidatus Atribacteria bacterium 1244-E10-H5-B2]|nr:MAG: hypothetical protein ES695_03220 [Candidatus Atribacteria bacterium 1244-E10-H5-B2]
MINEERKFISVERIRRKGLYNMLMDWQKVLKYAKRYLKIEIQKEEYFFIIENYSDLRARYLR